jgi:hypothetical protein
VSPPTLGHLDQLRGHHGGDLGDPGGPGPAVGQRRSQPVPAAPGQPAQQLRPRDVGGVLPVDHPERALGVAHGGLGRPHPVVGDLGQIAVPQVDPQHPGRGVRPAGHPYRVVQQRGGQVRDDQLGGPGAHHGSTPSGDPRPFRVHRDRHDRRHELHECQPTPPASGNPPLMTTLKTSTVPSTVGIMGFLDKAKDLLGQHDEQVDQALEHGGELAKDRFAGHDAHIDGAVDRAQEMTGAGDTVPDNPPPPPPAP